jgi:outer membrane protein assembly factor BamB
MVPRSIALASLAASAAVAQPAPSITGWWRAALRHNGETQAIWLHIQDRDGKLIASFSNPEIGIDDAPLSRVTDGAQSVDLTSIGWTLRKESDGTLSGVIPEALVPVYAMPARFSRSTTPARAPSATSLQASPAPVWSHEIGSAVYGGLAFDTANKLVVVATDSGKVAALRAADGTVAWSVDVGAPVRATPTIRSGALYVPTDKTLLKLDAATGKRKWSAPIGEGKARRLDLNDPNSRWDHYSSSAVVADDAVYVGSRDGCVYRFNTGSGAKLGTYCAADMVTSTPLVDGGRVYFASFDKNVYAADIASAKVLWKRDMHGEVPRDLVLAGDKIMAGSRSYDLTALDKRTGAPSWNHYYWFSWIDSPPTVVGSTAYVGSSDSLRVYALDSASGRKRWESRVPGWTWAKPAVGKSTIYASVAGTATPYVGPRLGGFAAIDKATGRLRWLIPSDKPDKAPVYGFASAPVVANGMVYAADLKGRVLAFRDR